MKNKNIYLKLLLLLLLCPVALTAQDENTNPKRIFITLDVSMSMEGNRYNMANYTAQTISVFSNSDDQLIVYYLNEKHGLGKKGYKDLHKSFESLPQKKKNYHEIKDLLTFMNDYKPDAKYQDWLFIIGDGVWKWAKDDFEETTKKCSAFIDVNEIQVCYLQTGDSIGDTNSFTSFLESLTSSKIDVQRSDTTAASVLGRCTYFANKILGFSNTNIKINQESDQCATFSSEFPLNRFLLVYQSNSLSEDDLKLESAEFLGNGITYKLKGNPTTKPLVKRGDPFLCGSVWEMEYPQTIPANEAIKICFNQSIDVANLNVYPYVDVVLSVLPYSTEMGLLDSVKKDVFEICNKENKVVIVVKATDSQGRKFEPPLMQRMDVKFVIGNQEFPAAFFAEDTTFRLVVDMPTDSLSFYSKVESPGYFSRVSFCQTVVKTADVCPPERVPLITLPVQRFDGVSFGAMREGQSFGGLVDDSLFNVVASRGVFDKELLSGPDSWMLDPAGMTVEDGRVVLSQRPKSDLCECAFPDTLSYEVTLLSQEGIQNDGKLYEGFVIPIKVPVEKQGWWFRCWVYCVALVGLLLLLLYIRALRRKHRFGKQSSIKSIYYDRYGDEVDDNYQLTLREEGFGAWLARWFWPGDEKNTLSFVDPESVSMSFVAGDSINTIKVPGGCIDPLTIAMDGYDFEDENSIPDYIKLANNSKIEVLKNSESKAGYLMYIAGDKAGEGGFRLLTSLLIIAAVAAEGFVIWTLFKSLTGL